MEATAENNRRQTAQEFVDTLLTEGAKVNCDDTSENFRNFDTLPPFYDEELFKRAQQFFYRHIFAFFFAKCFGLIAVMSVPSILKILMFTKMSGSNMTAYRRYIATIFHMIVWYKSDFKPGSKLWRSIAEVKGRHNSVSNRSCSAGIRRISQRDMALTQFGFMGFSLCRSEMLGIHRTSDEEWQAFIHLWRVVGYLMGIEDRFNLCSGTLEETREKCNIILGQVFRPYIEEKNEGFLKMSRYMVDGLWSLNLVIKYETIMCYLHILTQDDNNNRLMESTHYQLTPAQKPNLRLLRRIMYLLSYNWFRIFQNYTRILALWLVRYFPFLAIYEYGFSNAFVPILVKRRMN